MQASRRGKKGLSAVCFCLAGLLWCRAPAGVLEVPEDFSTIDAAIAAAEDGDTILVGAGVYELDAPIRFNSEAAPLGSPVRDLELRSVEGPDRTLLHLTPQGPLADSSVLVFAAGETEKSVVDGFTLTGGSQDPTHLLEPETYGGGIRIDNGSSPTLRRCVIRGNSAPSGGGVSVRLASARLEDCIIEENVAVYGDGGGVLALSSRVYLVRCTVRKNAAIVSCIDSTCISASGGGLSLAFSEAHFEDCIIQDNSADYEGGGISLVSSGGTPVAASLDMVRCTVSGNRAERGGGIAASRNTARLRECLIANNVAPVGSAIIGAELGHCTVTGNAGTFLFIGRTLLRSCIVWGNDGGLGPDELEASFSCFEGSEPPTGEGNIASDPQFCGWGQDGEVHVVDILELAHCSFDGPVFVSLAEATTFDLRLGRGSPCLGAGENGTDMGAPAGLCDTEGVPHRTIQIGAGTFDLNGAVLSHGVSLIGRSAGQTTLVGTVKGLRSGSRLESVTVTGGDVHGGVHIGAGQAPLVADCIIRGNLANNSGGGGVFCGPSSKPTLTRCRMEGNFAVYGAGVAVSDYAQAVLRECTLIGNLANSLGSAVAVGRGAEALLENCLVVGNFSDSGQHGQAIYLGNDCRISLIHSTVASNFGAQVASLVFFNPGSRLDMKSSIVAHNGGEIIGFRESMPTITLETSDLTGGALPDLGEGNFGLPPSFSRLGRFQFTRRIQRVVGPFSYPVPNFVIDEGDYGLSPESPLLDRGSRSVVIENDLSGNPRPCGPGLDIGALESCEALSVPSFIRSDTNSDLSIDLSDAILLLNWLFQGGRAPECLASGDSNDDGQLDCSDAIQMLGFLFVQDTPPAPPFPACGKDHTPDDLVCPASSCPSSA